MHQCPKCDKSFRLANGLSRHLGQTHGQRGGASVSPPKSSTSLTKPAKEPNSTRDTTDLMTWLAPRDIKLLAGLLRERIDGTQDIPATPEGVRELASDLMLWAELEESAES